MASPSFMTYSIHINYKRVFDRQQEEEEFLEDSEPHLVLGLGCVIGVNDAEILNFMAKSRHLFIDCTPSILKTFMQEKEALPMDSVMENEDAEMMWVRISHAIVYQVRSCVGVVGLKRLQVEVILKVHVKHQELDVREIFREIRMGLVQKKDYMGDEMDANSSTSIADKEVCAICLKEMVEGGDEVVCTPCNHQFHAQCIIKWFEISGLCPLCRFDIGP